MQISESSFLYLTEFGRWLSLYVIPCPGVLKRQDYGHEKEPHAGCWICRRKGGTLATFEYHHSKAKICPASILWSITKTGGGLFGYI